MLKVACSGPVSRTRNLSITSPILYQLDHCTHYSVLRILVKLGKSHHFFVIFWLSNGHLIGWLILLFFIFFYFLLAFVVNKDVQIGSVFTAHAQCIVPNDSCAPHCINRYRRDKCPSHWWTSSTLTPEFRVPPTPPSGL